MNVFLDLQSRQWRQVEEWDIKMLGRLVEERELCRLRDSYYCRNVVKNKQSTLAIAFSCDGQYVASSHLSHEIVIQRTRPHLHTLHILSECSPISRSPWCLAFHLSRPHHLLSGTLGGTVHLWDVQVGSSLCCWMTGLSTPINGLAFLPSHPDHFLVAHHSRLCLMHHRDGRMELVWSARTADATNIIVRLVLHHPECPRILTAITNPSTAQRISLNNHMQKSAYQLQMYPYTLESGPDLEDASTGLIAMAVRILSPQSVVLTAHFVISCSAGNSSTRLSMHSIDQQTFGQCLYSIAVTPENMSVVSLDLSVCQRFLLVGLLTKRCPFHVMSSHKSCIRVFQFNGTTSTSDLQLLCELSGEYAANVARWLPLHTGGCVCVGTQLGEVVVWGHGSDRWTEEAGGGRQGDITRHCSLKWFPSPSPSDSTHSHTQS